MACSAVSRAARRRAGWLLAFFGAALLSSSAPPSAHGQEPQATESARPRATGPNPHAVHGALNSAQPASAPEIVPVKLRTLVLDARRYQESQHDRKQQGAKPVDNAAIAMPNLAVKVRVRKDLKDFETFDATTDASGLLTLDLGERAATSEIEIEATANGVAYLGFPMKAAATMPETVFLFRVADNPGALNQQIRQVVTVRDDGKVQVRQIVLLQNLSWEVFQPQTGRVAYSFPVPANATMTSLTVDDDEVPNQTSRHDAFWGQGVPIDGPIYPVKIYQLMGVYELTPSADGTVQLDLESPLEIRQSENGPGYMLMVETGKVHYSPPTGRNQVVLQDGGPMDSVQLPKPVHSYSLLALPARTKMPITLYIGAAPISTRTKVMTAVILLVLGGSIGVGLLLARGRRRPASVLEDRVLRGELDIADYQRLAADDSSAGLESGASRARLSQLEAIIQRCEDEPADLDRLRRDVRALATLLRDAMRQPEQTRAG
ncbi:MAG: hypothetical protein ACKVX7_10570 [Planctomycetota bacterium]